MSGLSGSVAAHRSSQERAALTPVFALAAEAAEFWVEHGIAEAMNRFNSWRPSTEAAP